jgi:hypothetical protein
LYFEWADRDQLFDRRAPGARASQVDQVQNQAVRLLVEGAIDQARAFHD